MITPLVYVVRALILLIQATLALVLASCGGGSRESPQTSNAEYITHTVDVNASQVALPSNGFVIADIKSGTFSRNSTISVQSGDTFSNPEPNSRLQSAVVKAEYDPGALSPDSVGSLTINLPLTPLQAGIALVGGALVAKVKLGDAYKYMKATATSAKQVSISLSSQVLIYAKGSIEAAVYAVQESSTPDGQLFTIPKSSDPERVVGRTTPTPGKLPLVLVHGIQAICFSEQSAYRTTWDKFAKFFYDDPELGDRFSLYSFSYRTHQSIAQNGARLREELISAFGDTRVVVLAHSMGGLVARYADSTSTTGLQGLLTLNTPHHGTSAGVVALDIPMVTATRALTSTLLRSPGLPSFILSSMGVFSQCQEAIGVEGALDLQWDNFDAADPEDRCTAKAWNSFLCADVTGLNRRPTPRRLYIYSSQRSDNADWTQKASGWVIENSLAKQYLADDGSVPLASQQFQTYDDKNPVIADRYAWRGDARTANHYIGVDHLEIHDSERVFTTGGIGGGGLRTDLLQLAGKDPGVTMISAGGTHTCAIKGGAVWCWGLFADWSKDRQSTELIAQAAKPVIFPLPGSAVWIASGGNNACAVVTDGNVWCWGNNHAGSTGDGTSTFHLDPRRVLGVEGASSVAVSDSHGCAVLWNGRMKCWGNNTAGQLGNGKGNVTAEQMFLYANDPSLAKVPASDVLNISRVTRAFVSHYGRSCAQTESLDYYCWGSNYGDLWNFYPTNPYGASSPILIPALKGSKSISLDNEVLCKLDDVGINQCIGLNNVGQRGDSTYLYSEYFTQTKTSMKAVSVESKFDHSCALLDDKTVACWGRGYEGANGSLLGENSAAPISISGLMAATHISVGGQHACAIELSGAIKCWGKNDYGSLGDSVPLDAMIRTTPIVINLR